MFAPSLFCLWSDKKKKEKEKSKKKENMACEEYRAESAELNVTSSPASWRAWISSRVGKFKAQTITDPSQSHSKHYAASSGEVTSWLPTRLTEQHWTHLIHMGLSPGKECMKNQAKALTS